ncbi:MAG: polyprenyl diphosphate synthase [Candidatus Omnitrophica bacterium]|nr:polyprenyl diphosphate synthase [Candidatus Omnitrophota bacterium]MCM8789163.1 polyprenyl diphosphate synthase [Candidatus Omnitrophota bacterium]
MPVHVAIIMDGNRRWARVKGLPSVAGHEEGLSAVRRIVKAAVDYGVKYLTLYSFSTENWKRPPDEVKFLFMLMESTLTKEIENLHSKSIRVRFAGRLSELPKKLQGIIARAEKLTGKNSGLNLTFAVNYGGRQEILDAIKKIIDSRYPIHQLDQDKFRQFLYCPELPDVDLVIRTAGEQRLSNFLIWQSIYAEFYFTRTLWPEFSKKDFKMAIDEFSRRERRFGGL